MLKINPTSSVNPSALEASADFRAQFLCPNKQDV